MSDFNVPQLLSKYGKLMEGAFSTEAPFDIAQQDREVGIAVIPCLQRRGYTRRPNLEALVRRQPEDATTAPAM